LTDNPVTDRTRATDDPYARRYIKSYDEEFDDNRGGVRHSSHPRDMEEIHDHPHRRVASEIAEYNFPQNEHQANRPPRKKKRDHALDEYHHDYDYDHDSTHDPYDEDDDDDDDDIHDDDDEDDDDYSSSDPHDHRDTAVKDHNTRRPPYRHDDKVYVDPQPKHRRDKDKDRYPPLPPRSSRRPYAADNAYGDGVDYRY
jgi:hypothetical protein